MSYFFQMIFFAHCCIEWTKRPEDFIMNMNVGVDKIETSEETWL